MAGRRWIEHGKSAAPDMPERFRRAIGDGLQTLPNGRIVGVRPDPVDFRDQAYAPGLVDILPRLMPEPSDIPAIRDQGGEDSCTGQALAAVIDAQNRRRYRTVGGDPPAPVSARMLYEMARAHDENAADLLSGSTLRGAVKGFYHNGACTEKTARYRVQEFGWKLNVCMAKEARSTGLGAYFRVKPVLYDYHAALCEAGAILVSAMVHRNWDKASAANGGRIVQPADGELTGAHAFAVIGYDADGFIVLNSRGEEWGGFENRPGIGHWSYSDWQAHVLDAWVLRLTVPSPKTFQAVGGFRDEAGRPTRPRGSTTPRIEVNGHYLHLRKGAFVRSGAYGCDIDSARETAGFLREDGEREQPAYDHLAVHLETGLETIEEVAARAATLIPAMKQDRIYPLFVQWHAGMRAEMLDLLEAAAVRVSDRTGNARHLRAIALENFARKCLRPFWERLEANADASMKTDGGDFMSAILRAAVERARPMRVHFVAHASGVRVLAALLARAMPPGEPPRETRFARRLGTVGLLAPTCSKTLFREQFAPLLDVLGDQGRRSSGLATKPDVYVLPSELEDEDSVGPYPGSWLKLAKAAFMDDEPLGLEGAAETLKRTVRVHMAEIRGTVSRCRSHLGFVDDVTTLLHIRQRILGTPLAEGGRT